MSLWKPEQSHQDKSKSQDNSLTSTLTQNTTQQYTEYGTPVDAPVHDPYTPSRDLVDDPDRESALARHEAASARRMGIMVVSGLFALFIIVSLFRLSDNTRPYRTATPGPTVAPADLQRSNSISFDRPVQGTLSTEPFHRYTFYGHQGEQVTFYLDRTNGDLDPILTLSDSTNYTIVEDDNSGGNLNALLCDVELPATGEYRVDVRGFQGSTGSYRLTMERGNVPPVINPISSGALSARGQFPSCDNLYFTFDVATGDTIHVVLESESGTHPEMNLADAAGNLTSIRAYLPTPDFVQNSLTAMPTVLPLSIATWLPTYLPVTATALGDNPRLEITTDPVSRDEMYTLTVSERNETTGSFSLTIDLIPPDGATPAPTRTLAPGASAETTPEVTDMP